MLDVGGKPKGILDTFDKFETLSALMFWAYVSPKTLIRL